MEQREPAKVSSVKEYLQELDRIEKAINTIAHESPEAEWYVRGFVYHGRNLVKCYCDIIDGAIKRINTVGLVDVLVMYTPTVQPMMFEFYALINLLRISLDGLRNLLAPIFITPFNQLPKSITEFKPGTTNCPIYENLANNESISYLIDIRNCVVHFRSFTTKDNTIAIQEGVAEKELAFDSEWAKSITKASFRVDVNKLIFNIYLPDEIFIREPDGNKKLAKFTYNNHLNIIAESLSFIQNVANLYLEALTYLHDNMTPRFEFRKTGYR